MATISKTGIVSSQTIQAAHITNIIDALDGTTAASIVATGGLTGSLLGDIRGNVTGSVTGSVLGAFNGTMRKLVGTTIGTSVNASSLYSGKFYIVSSASGAVTITLDDVTNASGGGSNSEYEFVVSNLTSDIVFATGSGCTITSEDSKLKMNKVGSGAFVKTANGKDFYLIGSLKA